MGAEIVQPFTGTFGDVSNFWTGEHYWSQIPKGLCNISALCHMGTHFIFDIHVHALIQLMLYSVI